MAKKPATQDWHKADIVAAIHKAGHTFKGLSLANGYRSVDACSQALHRPYPKVERIVAAAIGVMPEVIWPSRYNNTKSSKSALNRPDKATS
jgi:Ner family transcriptional regulator